MKAANHPDIGMAFCRGIRYPKPPFHPPELYPEFGSSCFNTGPFDPENSVYPLVREALFRHLGGYDFKTKNVDLSVFGRFGHVKKIVVKPNWVYQQEKPEDCVTTHGSILRPLLDYLLLVLGPSCQIVVADVPLQSADINQIWMETGVNSLREYYESKALPVRFMDFRLEKAVIDSSGFVVRREPLPGDPLGYVEVSLGSESFLEPISNSKSVFSVNDYEPGKATCYHRPGVHRYLISSTVLAADLFVNVPKFKTHMKAGITVCMKNLIGINAEKGWIPHFRMGSPHNGGDEHSESSRYVLNLKSWIRNSLQGKHRWTFQFAQSVWNMFKKGWETTSGASLTGGGAWHGNDTLWRSILDLVMVITFADQKGKLMDMPQRHHLCLVDGIICGEGEGPLKPSPKAQGIVLCSSSPISADWTACHMAGLNWRKIPQLYHASNLKQLSEHFPECPELLTASWNGLHASTSPLPMIELPVFPLKPPPRWVGNIEAELPETFRDESGVSFSR